MAKSDKRKRLSSSKSSASSTISATTSQSKARRARNNKGQSADTSDSLSDPKYDLRFCCLEGAYYHGMRATFFNNVHRFIMAVVLISSSATMAGLLTSTAIVAIKDWIPYFGIIPLVVSTLDLVISPGLQAQTHHGLKARYYELLADIEEGTPSKENFSKWRSILHRIYAQEPAVTYKAVKAVAYNATVDMMFNEKIASKKRLEISDCARLKKSFCTMADETFKPTDSKGRS